MPAIIQQRGTGGGNATVPAFAQSPTTGSPLVPISPITPFQAFVDFYCNADGNNNNLFSVLWWPLTVKFPAEMINLDVSINTDTNPDHFGFLQGLENEIQLSNAGNGGTYDLTTCTITVAVADSIIACLSQANSGLPYPSGTLNFGTVIPTITAPAYLALIAARWTISHT